MSDSAPLRAPDRPWVTPAILRLGESAQAAGGEGIGFESDTPTAGPSS